MRSRKRPSAVERRAAAEREAEEARKREAARREALLMQMTGDLAVADVLLDRARSLTDPDRPTGHSAEPTLLRAFLLAAIDRVHRSADAARYLHATAHLGPPAP